VELAGPAGPNGMHRGRRARSEAPLPDEQFIPDGEAAEDASDELLGHLDGVMEELDEDERGLVTDKYMESKDTETLARERGTTAKAVESKLARIRGKMRDLLMGRLQSE
jgi:DNA-directed RNA polymerase specialized sigma24 family protein